MVVSIVTVVISVVSLAVSGVLVLRQMRIARDGYALPVVLDMFGKLRTDEYFAADQYVLHKFRAEVPDVVALTALPTATRAHLRVICGLYDDLGKLVAHGIVSEELVVGSRGDSVTRVWDIVAPFVYEERRVKGTHLWIYLEDLAARAARTPAAEIHAKLGLLEKAPATALAAPASP